MSVFSIILYKAVKQLALKAVQNKLINRNSSDAQLEHDLVFHEHSLITY